MKSLKFSGLSILFCLVFTLFISCNSSRSYDKVDYIQVEGIVDSALNNQTIYLFNPFNNHIDDSCKVANLHFTFNHLDQYVGSSVIRQLQAVYPIGNISVPIFMPVVIENGEIWLKFGEYQAATGSVLNDQLNDFLLDINEIARNVTSSTPEDAKAMISDYLVKTIKDHQTDVLGAYLYHAYAPKIDPVKYEELKSAYGSSFESMMK